MSSSRQVQEVRLKEVFLVELRVSVALKDFMINSGRVREVILSGMFLKNSRNFSLDQGREDLLSDRLSKLQKART